ncbi:hypothetical protein ZIOFF_056322 [Zingiber officinale]|uniref:Rab-GAP TBC domain-containing protein n=1 Tax=Zingiber officinale TaxID=94328 RepID=A0A8J5FHW5_ZINOF|nr:hypothetical protein ZIOFF_056322 [Zingiber officinale]
MMSSGEEEPTRNDVATTVGGSSGGGGIPSSNPEWRFNQTLRNVQGLVAVFTLDPHFVRSLNQFLILGANVNGVWNLTEVRSYGRTADNANLQKTNISLSTTSSAPSDAQEKLPEFSWSGVPPSMRHNIWRLLLGYAPPNSDRRDGILARKGLEYVECVAQYYDIPDTERSMLTARERYPILVSSTMLKFRNPWNAFFIHEPVSRHMEEQGLEFLQFAFRWFNCLLIREIPFHLVTLLRDTYLAEADSLPDFLCICVSASLLLTWSDKLQKFDFQEMVMFLQHLPTEDWNHHELEMVLSWAFMWHTISAAPRVI